MDLETENRIAAILLREAAELRRQAEREGVRAYLEKPNVRHRPNSRFLTATVLGVQQANKAVEVSEMWKARNKELELNERLKRKSRDQSSSHRSEHATSCSRRSLDKRYSSADENVNGAASSGKRTSKRYSSADENVTGAASSSKRTSKRYSSADENATVAASSSKRYDSEEDEGLRDEEIETFLQSRIKRGRGSIGPRMDETGPYLPMSADAMEEPSRTLDIVGREVSLRPERPSSPRQDSDSSSEGELSKRNHKKVKKAKDREKKHSKKHKSKEKKDRKKRKEEKRKRDRD